MKIMSIFVSASLLAFAFQARTEELAIAEFKDPSSVKEWQIQKEKLSWEEEKEHGWKGVLAWDIHLDAQNPFFNIRKKFDLDATSFEGISCWIFNERASTRSLAVVIRQDPDLKSGACNVFSLPLDWEGWKEFKLPFQDFVPKSPGKTEISKIAHLEFNAHQFSWREKEKTLKTTLKLGPITLYKEQKGPRASANILNNGGFEAGPRGGWMEVQFPLKTDRGTAHSGSSSVRIQFQDFGQDDCMAPRTWARTGKAWDHQLRSQACRIDASKPHSLSAWVKTDLPKIPVTLSLMANGGETPLEKKTVAASQDWTCVALDGVRIPDGVKAVWVEVSAPPQKGGSLWIDDIQLQEGPRTDFVYHAEHEAGIVWKAPSGVYGPEDRKEVSLLLHNASASPWKETLALKAVDFFGSATNSSIPVEVPPGASVSMDIPLPLQRFGSYRLELESSSGVFLEECIVSIVPKPRALPPEKSFVGGHYGVFDEESIAVAEKLGNKWLRSWGSSGRLFIWALAEKEEGKAFFLYKDYLEKLCTKYGQEILATVSYAPEWSAKYPAEIDPAKHNDYRGVTAFMPVDSWKFGRFFAQLAKAYPSIRYYELWNEPYGLIRYKGQTEKFAEFLIAGRKAVDSEKLPVKIMGPCAQLSEGAQDDFVKLVAKNGGLKALDIFAFHGYDGFEEANFKCLSNWTALTENPQMEKWNTETGLVESSFYKRVYNGRRSFLDSPPNSGEQCVETLVKSAVENLAHGVKRYFWYGTARRMCLLPAIEEYSTFEYDDALRPAGEAYAILAWMIDGLECKGSVSKGDSATIRVFAGDGRCVAVAYGKERKAFALKLPASSGMRLSARNVMGGELGLEDGLRISNMPVYLESQGASAENFISLLKGAELEPALGEELQVLCEPAKREGETGARFKVLNGSSHAIDATLAQAAGPDAALDSALGKKLSAPAKGSAELFWPLSPDARKEGKLSLAMELRAGGKAQELGFQLAFCEAKRGAGLGAGDLSKWEDGAPWIPIAGKGHIVFGGENWNGDADCSARFKAARDEKSLWIAVKVKDDFVSPPPEGAGMGLWAKDCVELFMDSAPELPRRKAVTKGLDSQLLVSPRAGASGECQVAATSTSTPLPHLKSFYSKLPDGYWIELEIPLGELFAGKAVPDSIGFDLAIDDADDGGRKLQMVWSGSGDNFKDPSRYGTMFLK